MKTNRWMFALRFVFLYIFADMGLHLGNENKSSFHSFLFCIWPDFDKILTLIKAKVFFFYFA